MHTMRMCLADLFGSGKGFGSGSAMGTLNDFVRFACLLLSLNLGCLFFAVAVSNLDQLVGVSRWHNSLGRNWQLWRNQYTGRCLPFAFLLCFSAFARDAQNAANSPGARVAPMAIDSANNLCAPRVC